MNPHAMMKVSARPAACAVRFATAANTVLKS
jgi:hypothetical protein